MKSLISLAAILGLLTLAAPAQALKLKKLDIVQSVSGGEYPAVRVKFNRVADNWTEVSSAPVDVRIDWQVDVQSSYALAPPSKITLHLDNMEAEEELRSTNIDITETHSGTLALRRAGNTLVEIKAKALEICSQIRGNGGKPDKEHRITRLFMANAYVEAYNTATWFTEETASKKKLMRVDVICEQDPDWHEPIKPAARDLAADLGDLRVIKAELFLTTFKNQVTHPTPGTSCPKLQVKWRVETNKPGQLSYTLWRQPGDKKSQTRYFARQDSGPFKGRSVIEETFWETFDQTTYVQYMLETAGYPVGVSTPWKDINILCTGPGGGGLAGSLPPGAQGGGSEMPRFNVIDSNVTLQRLPGSACPARVKVVATYRTNMPGTFTHLVGCSNGVTQQGTLSAQDAIGGGNYGVRKEFIVDVAQSGELSCSARAVDFPNDLARRKLPVQCHGGPKDKARARPTPPNEPAPPAPPGEKRN